MENLPDLPDTWRRALLVMAHPDDPEYGTAAAVAEWTRAGKEVSYLLATRGEAGIAGIHRVSLPWSAQRNSDVRVPALVSST